MAQSNQLQNGNSVERTAVKGIRYHFVKQLVEKLLQHSQPSSVLCDNLEG